MLHRLPHDLLFRFHSPQHDGKDATERETKPWNSDCISIENNKSSVQIKVSFFARAQDLTGLSDLPLEVSYGSTTEYCLNKLVAKFPSLEEIWLHGSCFKRGICK
ncbi:molybdopterin synthase sulfur carrier subunit-like [Pistacia vera]|uniref:molybdopterin synthase sulfur carrier subunit-like n=1 Tax=Pistacia vera TaxID=55513 RepID=UPI001262D747|nr:molybdopterin synthase sulfur carrier subunit-like [Pistacia vera]